MRRVLIIAALVCLALGGAWLALFGTPPGRRLFAEMLESRIEKATGTTAEIGTLTGALPARVVARSVSLGDARGVWITVDRIELDWRPLELLRGRFVADAVIVEGARLERRPIPRGDPQPFRLPSRLPPLSIQTLQLHDLTVGESIAGRQVSLSGDGALAMSGAALKADLRLTGAGSGDSAVIAVDIDPDTDRLALRLDIASPDNGALSALAGMGGAVSAKASGEGALRDFTIDASAALGAIGALTVRLSGDLTIADEVQAIGDFQWGSRLAPVALEIGPSLAFDVALRKTADGFAADVRRASAEAGTASGALVAKANRAGAITLASADAAVSLATPYRPDLHALLGGDAKLSATVEDRGGAYAVSGSVRAPRATLRFIDAARRGQDVSALVDLDLRPSPVGPAFARGGLAGRGRLTRAPGGRYALAGARIQSAVYGLFSGAADFTPAVRAFALDGEARLEPAILARSAPFLRLTAPLPATVAAKGTLDDFAVRTAIILPKTKEGGDARFAADLSGLPHAPRGTLAFERRGGVAARAELDTLARGVVRAKTLTARAKDFTLDGAVSYAAPTRTLSVDLRYAAKAATEIWPDVVLDGDGRLEGVLALGSGRSKLSGSAKALQIGSVRLAGVSGGAEGFAENLAVSGKVRLASFGDLPALSALKIEASADLSARKATATSLSAELNGAPLRLVRPATLHFAEGLAVADASLSVGDKGFVALDAAASARRWTAKARGENLPLSAAGSAAADFSFSLDTDKPIPGAGAFHISASAAGGATYEIGGTLRWDGRRVRVEDSGANPAFDLALDAPAVLRRGTRLSLDRGGSLRGAARFKGPVEAIADFLPAPLQTLEGELDGAATLAGTTEQPSLSGSLSLSDGTYTELVSGLSLTRLAATLKAEPAPGGSIARIAATGRGAGESRDSLRFEGTARLGADSSFDGVLTFADAALSADLVERAVINGAARLSGPLGKLGLSGDLNLRALDYRIKAPKRAQLRPIEVRAVGADAPERVQVAAPRPSLAFDIRLAAANNVAISGRGLDSIWKARLNLAGRSEEPALTGRLDLQRGTIDFSGRRFSMTRGSVVFDRLLRNDPTLDMRAERRTGDGVLAVITLRGRASAPEVELTSVPAAPQEDVTALVLFGKRAVELTAVESLQAAQALAQLSGFGDGATRAFGLDMLNVDFDTETGAGAVAVGKTVARGLFVSARQDVRGENGSVRVEYGVTDAFSIETELKQTGDQTISVNWKKDF